MRTRTSKGLTRKIATLLASACLGLAAFGGTALAATTTATEAPPATSATTTEVTADDFVGTWTLAAAVSNGVTMGGQFGEMFGAGSGGSLVIKSDGTGTFSLGENAAPITWTYNGDGTISVDAENAQSTIPVAYKDGALFLTMTQDDQSADLIFTEDGTYAGLRELDLSKATPITSEDELLGTWELVGMDMMGITVFGEPEDVIAMSGGTDPTITFEEGGSVITMGVEAGTWAIGKDGATYGTTGFSGPIDLPMVMLDDALVIDSSEAMGGMEFVMVYERPKAEADADADAKDATDGSTSTDASADTKRP